MKNKEDRIVKKEFAKLCITFNVVSGFIFDLSFSSFSSLTDFFNDGRVKRKSSKRNRKYNQTFNDEDAS